MFGFGSQHTELAGHVEARRPSGIISSKRKTAVFHTFSFSDLLARYIIWILSPDNPNRVCVLTV